jgi:hypothetical protein
VHGLARPPDRTRLGRRKCVRLRRKRGGRRLHDRRPARRRGSRREDRAGLIRYCEEGANDVVIRAPIGDLPIETFCNFRRNANEATAQATLRAAIPAIEAYYADHGTYAGISVRGLERAYDAGLRGITFGDVSGTAYCVQSAVGEARFRKTGPGAEIEPGRCPGAPVENAASSSPPRVRPTTRPPRTSAPRSPRSRPTTRTTKRTQE